MNHQTLTVHQHQYHQRLLHPHLVVETPLWVKPVEAAWGHNQHSSAEFHRRCQGSGSPPIGQLTWEKGPAVAGFPAASVELTEYW